MTDHDDDACKDSTQTGHGPRGVEASGATTRPTPFTPEARPSLIDITELEADNEPADPGHILDDAALFWHGRDMLLKHGLLNEEPPTERGKP